MNCKKCGKEVKPIFNVSVDICPDCFAEQEKLTRSEFRSDFKHLFPPEINNLTPENCKNDDEFIDIVTDEVWNLDEWTPEGIMMMKHFIMQAARKISFDTSSVVLVGNRYEMEILRELIKKEWDRINGRT